MMHHVNYHSLFFENKLKKYNLQIAGSQPVVILKRLTEREIGMENTSEGKKMLKCF